MVKYNDLKITLDYFKTSPTWDYGEYKLLSSDIINYDAKKADGSIDLTIAQRILDSNVHKSLNVIKRELDKKNILKHFSYADLINTRFIEAIPKMIESQLSGMITDGNKEIKVAANYSGSGVDSSRDVTGNLTSGDRLYILTEDIWNEYSLDQYEIDIDKDNNTISLIDNFLGTVKQVIGEVKLSDAQLQSIANLIPAGTSTIDDVKITQAEQEVANV